MNWNIIDDLKKHKGEFLCKTINPKENTKLVRFFHKIEPPSKNIEILEVGDIHHLYSLVGSLTLYHCPESDEAAFYLGHPKEWDSFEEEFADWVDMLDEDEQEEALPSWFGSHKVIGEIPASGNYILIVTKGNETGAIYEFEHDGFEFIKLGSSVEQFLLDIINPTPHLLSSIASHMRFISNSSDQQWWAKELRLESGEIVINED